MHAEVLVLRLVHVVGGALWAGGMVLLTMFLMPALQQAGPAAAPVMGALQQRRMMTYMPVIALLTILSGLRLYWIVSGGFAAEYVRSGAGVTFGAAALLATIAFVIGVGIGRPAMQRAGALMAGMQDQPEAERAALRAEADALRRRGARASLAAAVLVVLAAAGMAVARYM